ncbi:uncharacterized protein PGTG_07176 [Puccinia graminis f. sp. tritici CRL 75-36-700-3]|uniref:AB hydrolase-1 domain-containing protein n=1 Tax=Puccinia graminis f. sp. tritici (strain CRL 75-36-700-3 / race SCCL) TaxID=418459 RepID=E3K9N8_PUCGT|nr:uncharacterized protein PGTG_07176 [Puccinia graminis f. sp. tritici CRL 75-36-700-3]EFP80924.2 hypothetical protein PGTG_07176 [Puccinia graminis f. sp. tritici CRL 75-36-700-3]
MTAELPTLDTILDSATCAQKGLCAVANGRARKPRQLYYEVHGDLQATQKMVLIMGLNFTCSAWSEQVRHFGRKPDHAVLVFDNRGVGNSDCGSMEPYKTSEMAKDALDLLNFLKWDQDRSIHVFGVSLGGMISQELSLLIPSRIKSMTLISTRSGNAFDFPSLSILKMFSKVSMKAVTYEQGLDLMMDFLFPDAYLNQPTTEGRTRKDELRDFFKSWHNRPRRQSPAGALGQVCAAVGHHCSDSNLEKISQTLSPGKIAVVLGDRDEMIYAVRSLQLQDRLPGSELVVFKDGGHALSCQFSKDFNMLMERIMMEGNQAFAFKKQPKHI